MKTEAINVAIKADDTSVNAGMRSVSSVVQIASQQIKASLESIKSTALGVGNAMRDGFADGFRDAMREAEEAAERAAAANARVANSTGGLTSAFGGLRGIIAAVGLGALANGTVRTIAEFDRLRSVLATLEGGAAAGNSRFDQIKQFATETPFQLTEVVTAFTRLKSQGLDPSNAALMSYGNTAAAMGKSLGQFVEAVADASTGEMERLKEFGIKSRDAGNSVIFTFQGVSTEVSKSGGEIERYLQSIGNNQFAGAIERQMNTLGGAFSNVQDTVANFADAVGTGGLGAALRGVMQDFTAASQGSGNFASQLGDVLGAAVTQTWEIIKALGSVVNEVFKTIADIVRVVVGDNVSNMDVWQKTVNIVKMVFVALGATIRNAAIIITTALQMATNAVTTFVNAARSAANLDFSGAVNAVRSGAERQAEIFRNGANRILEDARQTRKQLIDTWNGTGAQTGAGAAAMLPSPGSVEGGGGSGAGAGKGSGAGSGSSQTAIQRFEEQLQAQRTALERQNQANNTFYAFSKEQEATFWRNILNTQRLSQREREDIERKYLEAARDVRRQNFDEYINSLRNELDEFRNNQDERLRIAKTMAAEMEARFGQTSREYQQAAREVVRIERAKAEQIAQINETIRRSQIDAAMAAVEGQRAAADFEEQMGLISAQQRLQREMEFEQQSYQIKLTALQERLALMEKDPDLNPVEYARIKAEIEAIELEHQGRMGQIRQQSFMEGQRIQLQGIQYISQSWGNTLAQMLVGQQSFAQGVRNLWLGLVGAITQALTSMIAQWIAKQLAAFLLGKVVGTNNAASQITANAGVAGSAAFASTAAIPIVGPALAPAAAAAAMAGALSFMPMAFAAKGYDIPAGVNPVTQLHQKEMVLPAEQADVIRQMAESGVGGSYSIHFHAPGSMSQSEMERHASTLVRILKNAKANREW